MDHAPCLARVLRHQAPPPRCPRCTRGSQELTERLRTLFDVVTLGFDLQLDMISSNRALHNTRPIVSLTFYEQLILDRDRCLTALGAVVLPFTFFLAPEPSRENQHCLFIAE